MPLHGTFTREWFAQGGESPRVFVLRSDDGGNNWEYWATVAYDPAHILEWAEAGMTRLSSGRLVCLLRTQARPARFDNMWFVYSDDDGASWSRPVRTPLWGYPADVIQLREAACSPCTVTGARRGACAACISDDGVTWSLRARVRDPRRRRGGSVVPSVLAHRLSNAWRSSTTARSSPRTTNTRRRAADPMHVGDAVQAVSDVDIVPLRGRRMARL